MIQKTRILGKWRFSGELLALGIGVFLLGGCAGGKPNIAVAAMRHDFGQIKQGDVVAAEIAVRNSGQKELKIESVATSCGCTSAQVKPKIIPSGGEGKLLVRYNSGLHPDKGPIERHVYIASNDPEKVEVDITITADVQPPA
ncbi:MAG: DUF1573 domain-containing protein [Alphaproteobacteria bacterium]